MKINLTINLDEISSDIEVCIKFLKLMGLKNCELRTINSKNIGLMSLKEIEDIRKILMKNNIVPISIASPICKWNISDKNGEFDCNDFGISTNLSDFEKDIIFENIIKNAEYLNVKIIRFFSGIGDKKFINKFYKSNILDKILRITDRQFLLENEPICIINTKREMLEFKKFIKEKRSENLGVWLDIANLIRIGEVIDEKFIKEIAPVIKYIHVKDFYYVNDKIKYVPVGKGIVDYHNIFKWLNKYLTNDEVVLSVETHASDEKEKYEYSKQSIITIKNILEEIQNDDKLI